MGRFKNIEAHAEHLAEILVDWNYSPEIVALTIKDAKSLEDIAATIKKRFNGADPFSETYYVSSREEMLEDLKKCFLEGNSGSEEEWFKKTSKEETYKEVDEFFSHLGQYVTEDSEVSIPTIVGVLNTPVIWWKFSFISLNKDGDSLFICGAASD